MTVPQTLTSLEILHICCSLDFFFIVTNPESLVCVMEMKDTSFLIRKKESNLSHRDADGSIPSTLKVSAMNVDLAAVMVLL